MNGNKYKSLSNIFLLFLFLITYFSLFWTLIDIYNWYFVSYLRITYINSVVLKKSITLDSKIRLSQSYKYISPFLPSVRRSRVDSRSKTIKQKCCWEVVKTIQNLCVLSEPRARLKRGKNSKKPQDKSKKKNSPARHNIFLLFDTYTVLIPNGDLFVFWVSVREK